MNFGLSEKIAKAIVERTMGVIPYNVNVMNSEGVIIASGDEMRIGYLHQGSLKAIGKNEVYEVRKETLTDKLGVNMPILYENNIIGVIGISGDPDQVKPLVYVIKVIAEVMIEQQYALNKDAIENLKQANFIREWCDTSRSNYNQEFIDKADRLGIKVDILRNAVMIEVVKTKGYFIEKFKKALQPGEFVIRYKNDILALLKDSADINNRIDHYFSTYSEIKNIGVGGAIADLSVSVFRAAKCLKFLKNANIKDIYRDNILRYDDYRIFEMVEHYNGYDHFVKIINELEEQTGNNDLKNTLITYLKYDGDINQVIEHLHIHRNTLLYRMKKIESITNKSFKKFNDLLYFYIAYIIEML